MVEFLHIEEVPLDELTDIYINELQIKFNTMLESFKKAIIPANQMEFAVKRELSFVIDLSKKIDMELADLEKVDDTPLPKVNGPISLFEYLAIQSTVDDLGPFIPDTIKNKDAYWKRVKLAYRKSLFEGYIWFLQGMLNTVFDISRSSEYWNMRTIAEMDKIREAPPEPAPDTQTPEVGTAAASKTDPVNATIKWLKNKERQYIIKYTEPETPVVLNGALERIKPPVSEWRITKPAAFIYRELCSAAEGGEIQFTKDAITDFMVNNLKQRDGGDITHDLLTKAEKRRQNQTK